MKIPWPAQSPELNTIEILWSVLESKMRRGFPPSSTLKKVEDILHIDRFSIPPANILNLYKYIPRRIQSPLETNVSQTPY